MAKFLVPGNYRDGQGAGYVWRCDRHDDTITWLEGTEAFDIVYWGKPFATWSEEQIRTFIDLFGPDLAEAPADSVSACRLAMFKEVIDD
jgi:hypothetical protein